MKLIILNILLIFFISFNWIGGNCKIEPVKFKENQIYTLENQHTGKYLSIGNNGDFVRTGDHGTPSFDQQWTLKRDTTKTGQEGWQFIPRNGGPHQLTSWKEIYVGHGKFIFRNVLNNNCLEASTRGLEVYCDREDLNQKWYPHVISS